MRSSLNGLVGLRRGCGVALAGRMAIVARVARAAGMAFAGLAALASPLLAQEVYRSTDPQGHVVYSDRGNSKTSPRTTVHVDEPDPAEVARLAHEQQLLDAQERQRRKDQAREEHDKALTQRERQQQRTKCDNARNYYFRLKDSNRVFRRDAEGNRVYYSDPEADAMRESARRAVAAACGGPAP